MSSNTSNRKRKNPIPLDSCLEDLVGPDIVLTKGAKEVLQLSHESFLQVCASDIVQLMDRRTNDDEGGGDDDNHDEALPLSQTHRVGQQHVITVLNERGWKSFADQTQQELQQGNYSTTTTTTTKKKSKQRRSSKTNWSAEMQREQERLIKESMKKAKMQQQEQQRPRTP